VPFPPYHGTHVMDNAMVVSTAFTDSDDAEIWIHRSLSESKFTVSHELGHAIRIVADPSASGQDYSDTGGGDPDCGSGANDHNWNSREFTSGADLEGWGNFYAAAAFNKRLTAADCWIYLPTMPWWVDCEGSLNGNTTPWMESKCTAPFNGKGVELDWTRQFWDVRTNSASSPTVLAMMQWIEDANDAPAAAWSNSNHFTLLDNEANDKGGILNTLWDSNKSTNGIVH